MSPQGERARSAFHLAHRRSYDGSLRESFSRPLSTFAFKLRKDKERLDKQFSLRRCFQRFARRNKKIVRPNEPLVPCFAKKTLHREQQRSFSRAIAPDQCCDRVVKHDFNRLPLGLAIGCRVAGAEAPEPPHI